MKLPQPQQSRSGKCFGHREDQGKIPETAYNVGSSARLRASMPKPSDILAVRMLILHVWTKLDGCRDVQNCEHLQRHDVQLMSVAARVCVSVTQRQETDANLSQNCFTKLILGSHSIKLERTFVCKYEIGTSHILGTWQFADSNTLGGSLSLQPFSIARPDDGGAANLSCFPMQWHSCCRDADGCSRVVHKQGSESGYTKLHLWPRWPRSIQLHMMIDQPPTVFEHRR